MKWITRENVKVDRVACPWLIKRFIDSDAQFEFLPKHTYWSSVRDGTLFDVPGCERGHHGQDVSFDSILKKHLLNDPALRLLAENVWGRRFSSNESTRRWRRAAMDRPRIQQARLDRPRDSGSRVHSVRRTLRGVQGVICIT